MWLLIVSQKQLWRTNSTTWPVVVPCARDKDFLYPWLQLYVFLYIFTDEDFPVHFQSTTIDRVIFYDHVKSVMVFHMNYHHSYIYLFINCGSIFQYFCTVWSFQYIESIFTINFLWLQTFQKSTRMNCCRTSSFYHHQNIPEEVFFEQDSSNSF